MEKWEGYDDDAEEEFDRSFSIFKRSSYSRRHHVCVLRAFPWQPRELGIARFVGLAWFVGISWLLGFPWVLGFSWFLGLARLVGLAWFMGFGRFLGFPW